MKKILFVLGFLVVAIIGLVALLPFLVPMEMVAIKAKEQVKLATGRDLEFSDAHLMFWPNLGVELKNVSLSNASWAKEKDMVTLGRMGVALAVKPLLEKRVEVKYFTLDAPVINLEVASDGRQNWVFDKPADAAVASEKDTATGGGNLAQDFDLKFGELEIKNGKVSYVDRKAGTTTVIDGLDITATFPDLKSALKLDGALNYKQKRVKLTLDLQKPMDLAAGKPTAGRVDLTTPDLALKANGKLATAGDMFSGNVTADISSLPALLAWVGDGKVQDLPITKINFTSDVTASASAVSLKGATLELDEVKANGDVRLQLGGKPDIYARLSLNHLNLDRFIGDDKNTPAPAQKTASSGNDDWDATPIDFSALKSANADLQLKTGGFSVKGVEVGASTLTVTLKDGKLDFTSSDASLFGGRFSSGLMVNAAPQVPTLAVNFKMNGVQAKPVLSQFADFDKLNGTAEANVSMTSAGNSQKAIVSALNGSGAVMFRNGSISGIDIVNIIQMVQKRLTDMKVGTGATEFVELGGTFTVAKGILTNNDLKMRGPLVQVTGKGTVDLPRKFVNYRIIPLLTASSASENASGLSVPVDITGPFTALKIVPDFASVVRDLVNNPDAAKQTLKDVKEQGKAIEKNLKDIKKDLKKDPAKAIENLFGGGLLAPAPHPAAP